MKNRKAATAQRVLQGCTMEFQRQEESLKKINNGYWCFQAWKGWNCLGWDHMDPCLDYSNSWNWWNGFPGVPSSDSISRNHSMNPRTDHALALVTPIGWPSSPTGLRTAPKLVTKIPSFLLYCLPWGTFENGWGILSSGQMTWSTTGF